MRWWTPVATALLLSSFVVESGCREFVKPDDPIDQGVELGDSDTDVNPDAVDGDEDGYTVDDDCDDNQPRVNPGMPEVAYDGVDNDCDPATPDDDLDADGFGLEAGDCDDADAQINPNAAELCDGVDNDCAGGVDDGLGDLFFLDGDGDGYGDPAAATTQCDPTLGLVLDGTDCDDFVNAVHPGAPELCNGVDDDCDGLVDDDDDTVVVTAPWVFDDDGDGFPGASVLFEVCEAPTEGLLPLTPSTLDCDDDDPRTYIGAAFRDAPTACMTDADEDGWGGDLPLDGIVAGRDCDDLDEQISPTALEVPYDAVDQDCEPANEWDADGDGAPAPFAPGGGTDCNDADGRVGSSLLDRDCDGALDVTDCRPDDATNACTLKQVALGDGFTCILFDDGGVRCWGDGRNGRTGHGSTATTGLTEPASDVADVDVGRPVTQISAGPSHVCAVTVDRTVRCWGDGTFGQLGYGNTATIGDDETPATAGDVPVGAPVVQVSAGQWHTCVTTAAGSVRCWGYAYPSLGYAVAETIGDDEPPSSAGDVPLGPLPVREVVAAANATCALHTNGKVRCWGYARDGQLGLGNTDTIDNGQTPGSVGPIQLPGQAIALALGNQHTCALLRDRKVLCWGYNSGGQLGLGHTRNIGDDELPTEFVPGLSDVTAISAGGGSTCALRANGTVLCWGNHGGGLLGFGNSDDIGDNELPTQPVDLGLPARAVSLGTSHACAIGGGPTEPLRCWGSKSYGAFGFGYFPSGNTAAALGDVPYR